MTIHSTHLVLHRAPLSGDSKEGRKRKNNMGPIKNHVMRGHYFPRVFLNIFYGRMQNQLSGNGWHIQESVSKHFL